jgi:hypothetical protein
MEATRLMRMATKQICGLIMALAATACSGCGHRPPPQPMPMYAPPPAPVAPMPMAPVPCDQAQYLATSTSMAARAPAEAPGMKPEGTPICGVAAQGQAVPGPMFVLEPGYCYTFLGQSLPPVGDMEMVLQGDATAMAGSLLPPSMAGIAGMAQAPLLVSTTPGERVNMGAGRSCYMPGPMPVKLLLKPRTGSGPVAGQVFRKKVM